MSSLNLRIYYIHTSMILHTTLWESKLSFRSHSLMLQDPWDKDDRTVLQLLFRITFSVSSVVVASIIDYLVRSRRKKVFFFFTFECESSQDDEKGVARVWCAYAPRHLFFFHTNTLFSQRNTVELYYNGDRVSQYLALLSYEISPRNTRRAWILMASYTYTHLRIHVKLLYILHYISTFNRPVQAGIPPNHLPLTVLIMC